MNLFLIKTNDNSITFKTSQNPLDNSKFIGTDWLYLKVNRYYNRLFCIIRFIINI